MNITIIGTGYVGLPTGVGMADLGHNVTCIDREVSKIEKLKRGSITLYEAGLEELLKKNYAEGRIQFTTSMQDAVPKADIVLIAVGTPPHPVTHEADMQYVHAAATELASFLDGYTVVATKSTVPVGTGDVLENLIRKTNPNADFDVVSLPEFLREGYAVHDFFNPDRIIVGANSQRAVKLLKDMYRPFENKTKMLFVSRRSSETIKYASNSFLAIKIHYINEIANFCEKAGADVTEVAAGMGLDSRIGDKFLKPGPGFGGSCFPKDTMAMSYMAHQNGVNLTLIDTTIKGNAFRKEQMAERIKHTLEQTGQSEPVLAVLGLAFKEGTDDCRESPAIEILQYLIKNISDKKIHIRAYDPQANESAKSILGEKIEYSTSIRECITGSNCIAILTEWPEFKQLGKSEYIELLNNKIILDFRNIIDTTLIDSKHYYSIGK